MSHATPCHRINPDEISWQPATLEGATACNTRLLFESDILVLQDMLLPSGDSCTLRGPCFMLVTQGELVVNDGAPLQPNDIFWLKNNAIEVTAANNGAQFFLVQPKGEIGHEVETAALRKADVDWQNFDDPAGRPTQPVQVLLDGSFSALRTRFVPEYIAGEHWHDFDTLYFIRDGRMQFGDEGWFETGEIRAVHGGHSYGPERPGDAGVEFVLLSLGGPVALHWSDLEPPP